MDTAGYEKFFKYWLPPLLLAALIVIFSSDLGSEEYTASFLKKVFHYFYYVENRQILKINTYLRSYGHILVYAILFLLIYRLLRGYYQLAPARASFDAFSWTLMIALFDEGHQSLTAKRTGSIGDILLDMSGVAIIAISIIIWTKIVQKRSTDNLLATIDFLMELGDFYQTQGKHAIAAQFFKKALSLMYDYLATNKIR